MRKLFWMYHSEKYDLLRFAENRNSLSLLVYVVVWLIKEAFGEGEKNQK
jgi:hypothetical protein